MKKLQVLYCGWGQRWVLGTLAHTQAGVFFEYSAEAVARGLELSPLKAPLPRAGAASVALRGPAHSHGLPGFIADALPDGWGLLLMDRAFARAGRLPQTVSVLERLAVVGHSAMGALAFEPVDALAQPVAQAAVSLTELAQQVQAVLADHEADGGLAAQQLQRLLQLGGSPQGARPKVLLRWEQAAQRFVPEPLPKPLAGMEDGGDASSPPWLVKFPARGEAAHVCALEAQYMDIAAQGGMDTPAHRCFELPQPHAALGVQRFDRVWHQGAWQRVPVLSFAALLDADFRLPALDYQMVLLATARVTGDMREVLAAFDRCVLHVLLHNRDDHAKNLALVMDAQGHWHLSPVFDLTFSFGPGGEHSTSVAGEGRSPTRQHLLQVAQAGGIKPAQANARIDHWLAIVDSNPIGQAHVAQALAAVRPSINRPSAPQR
jgi:serine/threonine-protein kinase HipA